MELVSDGLLGSYRSDVVARIVLDGESFCSGFRIFDMTSIRRARV